MSDQDWRKEESICPRHGGRWGDDETCINCTDHNGNMRPVTDEATPADFASWLHTEVKVIATEPAPPTALERVKGIIETAEADARAITDKLEYGDAEPTAEQYVEWTADRNDVYLEAYAAIVELVHPSARDDRD